MHQTAEYGIAAHWKYKESGGSKKGVMAEEEKMSWLQTDSGMAERYVRQQGILKPHQREIWICLQMMCTALHRRGM